MLLRIDTIYEKPYSRAAPTGGQRRQKPGARPRTPPLRQTRLMLMLRALCGHGAPCANAKGRESKGGGKGVVSTGGVGG